jgi:fido (protein-threonine AMPylation protein)
MPAYFDLLEKETEPSVRAVLGHWLFGYIHPYPDGNGRTARFLMNVMLASGGYPWTIIRLRDRRNYLAALDRASSTFVAKFVLPFSGTGVVSVRRRESVERTSRPAFRRAMLCKKVTGFPASLSSISSTALQNSLSRGEP